MAAGARVWVPHSEQALFHSVAAHWQAREVWRNYNMREDRFALLDDVPIAGTLRDYATLHVGAWAVEVRPTPGHTIGSVTLLAEVDGRRVAFSGDLIAAPGKLWSLAATQWGYNDASGVAMSIASLHDLQRQDVAWLLPSHGAPMDEPQAALALLAERLWALLQGRDQHRTLLEMLATPYQPILPHLLRNRTSIANSYVLLSQSGRAMLLDFGYDFLMGEPAGYDRASRRPWLLTLPALKAQFGVTAIDCVLPTHYHDDHVAGINLLREVEGAQVWAAESFAPILEHPARYDLPCLWYEPIPVDRVLPLGSPFPGKSTR